ncbi:unnamed protein product [Pleuronectes platessa]|uniref:Uncharacterized protein n=1 Tax=Pleuronectes platessa TaxID=8262 RepID=A0A9N7Z625_PLEPL|nr:unnamed protein product [Pleuronectes platessa]
MEASGHNIECNDSVMLECQVQAAASQLVMVSSIRAAALAATSPEWLFTYTPKSCPPPAFTRNRAVVTSEAVLSSTSVTHGRRFAQTGLRVPAEPRRQKVGSLIPPHPHAKVSLGKMLNLEWPLIKKVLPIDAVYEWGARSVIEIIVMDELEFGETSGKNFWILHVKPDRSPKSPGEKQGRTCRGVGELGAGSWELEAGSWEINKGSILLVTRISAQHFMAIHQTAVEMFVLDRQTSTAISGVALPAKQD